MGIVSYDSKKLIPAPLVTIRRDFQTSDDGQLIGTIFSLTLKGKIVVDKGSPKSDGTWHTGSGYPNDETIVNNAHLATILRKQEAIRLLFANEGRSFEIQSDDGSAPVKCNPRIKSIEFAEDIWYNTCAYTVLLEADVVYINNTVNNDIAFSQKISKASEEWAYEKADDKARTYRLTHTVTATGKRFFTSAGSLNKEAWQEARDWVLLRKGLDSSVLTAAGAIDLSGHTAYDYARGQTINEVGGSYTLTETWVLFDGGDALENFEVTSRTDENGRTTVTINGTITGFEKRNNMTFEQQQTRYTSAKTKFDTVSTSFHSRAQTYSGKTLNTVVKLNTVGRNPDTGIITYTSEYDDRPTPQITTARSESISLSYTNPADIFSKITVLGKSSGPVLQNIGSITERGLTITIEAVLPAATQVGSSSKPNTDALILSYRPVASQIFVASDQENWVSENGRYSRSVRYEYVL